MKERIEASRVSITEVGCRDLSEHEIKPLLMDPPEWLINILNSSKAVKKISIKDLSGYDLSNLEFKNFHFQDVCFEGSLLRGAKFEKCKFTNCKLTEVDGSKAQFISCKFSNVDFANSKFLLSRIIDSIFYTDLESVDFSESFFDRVEIGPQSLNNRTRSVLINNSNFQFCNWHSTNFNHVSGADNNFSEGWFKSCDLFMFFNKSVFASIHVESSDVSGELVECNFSNSKFLKSGFGGGRALTQLCFSGCIIDRAVFEDCDFNSFSARGEDFSSSILKRIKVGVFYYNLEKFDGKNPTKFPSVLELSNYGTNVSGEDSQLLNNPLDGVLVIDSEIQKFLRDEHLKIDFEMALRIFGLIEIIDRQRISGEVKSTKDIVYDFESISKSFGKYHADLPSNLNSLITICRAFYSGIVVESKDNLKSADNNMSDYDERWLDVLLNMQSLRVFEESDLFEVMCLIKDEIFSLIFNAPLITLANRHKMEFISACELITPDLTLSSAQGVCVLMLRALIKTNYAYEYQVNCDSLQTSYDLRRLEKAVLERFKSLALFYHPDRNPYDTKSGDVFNKIVAAKNLLLEVFSFMNSEKEQLREQMSNNSEETEIKALPRLGESSFDSMS